MNNRFQGRHYRLTNIAGELVPGILAWRGQGRSQSTRIAPATVTPGIDGTLVPAYGADESTAQGSPATATERAMPNAKAAPIRGGA